MEIEYQIEDLMKLVISGISVSQIDAPEEHRDIGTEPRAVEFSISVNPDGTLKPEIEDMLERIQVLDKFTFRYKITDSRDGHGLGVFKRDDTLEENPDISNMAKVFSKVMAMDKVGLESEGKKRFAYFRRVNVKVYPTFWDEG